MYQKVKNIADNLLYSYSTLIFMRSRILGLVLLLVTFINPNIAILGIISWATTFLFAGFIGLKRDNLIHSIYTYNSLLVGFSIGFLFKITLLSIIFTITASMLTVLLSFTLYSIFSYYFGLPVLNIPFTIVSTIIYLASVKYSALYVDSFYPKEHLNLIFLPLFLQGLLKATGVLLFSPYDLVGLIILLAILFYSRIAFFLTVFSYYLGILFLALLKGSFNIAFSNISSFNFILVGIALGSIFLIPSKKTYTIAFLGVLISVFLIDAASVVWEHFGIPIFTIPFNLTVLLFIYTLRLIRYPKINLFIKNSPEESLAGYLNFNTRFDYINPQIYLPFSGEWTVYQEFDGEWTHKAHNKYAYDFVITDSEGKTYKGLEKKPEDFYAFSKPVLSPISGTVVDFIDSLNDNPIGVVDKENNWGNFILLYSTYGYYVEISHLQKNSVKVKIGDFVKPGTLLANCGNSGYSPQPHIHIQVQYLPALGSETAKFYFLNLLEQNKMFNPLKILKKDEKVSPVAYSRKMFRIFQFILDDKFEYEVYKNDVKVANLSIITKIATDGSYYFLDVNSGDKLFFGFNGISFVFYSFVGSYKSYLKNFLKALPKMPITTQEGITWKEIIPYNVVYKQRTYKLFAAAFSKNVISIKGNYVLVKKFEVEGKITYGNTTVETYVKLNERKGIDKIEVKQKSDRITILRIG